MADNFHAHIQQRQLNVSYHGNNGDQGAWRVWQGLDCTVEADDLREGWGATPAEALADFVAVTAREPDVIPIGPSSF